MRRSMMLVAAAGSLWAAAPAWADFTKGQELTILAARSALLAAEHCPYAVDDRKLQQVLARKGLSRAMVTSAQGSALLEEDSAADAQRYANDTAAACDQAWASFGPGAPMAGLLRRK